MTKAMTRDHTNLDDRAPTIFGWAAALIAGGGIAFFWTIGAILLLSGSGGQIQYLQDEPIWRTLYFAYPVVFVAATLLGGLLLLLRRDLASIAVAGAPVVFAIGYYFASIHLRVF